MEKQNLREEVLNNIVNDLKNGTAPWRKGWLPVSLPYNMKSKNIYNGINLLNLAFNEMSLTDPRYATFNQIKEMGKTVIKGSKGIPIEFFMIYDYNRKRAFDEQAIHHLTLAEQIEYKNKYVKPFIQYSYVFNASQIEGIEPFFKKSFDLNSVEKLLLNNNDIKISFDGGRKAFYSLNDDTVHLPCIHSFFSKEEFLSTLLHELSHATMHENRLNRKFEGEREEAYALEELVAELSTVFLLSELGLEIDPNSKVFTNNKAYLNGWASKLSEKEESLYNISKLAYESVDYIKRIFVSLISESEIEENYQCQKRA